MATVKPLGAYNLANNHVDTTVDEMLVWGGLLDKRFKCEVHRDPTGTKKNTGILYIFDASRKDKIAYQNKVHLSYGAAFGPDIIDVESWQDICCDVIDNLGR